MSSGPKFIVGMRAAILAGFISLALLSVVCPRLASTSATPAPSPEPQRRATAPGGAKAGRPAPRGADYAKFSHHTPPHRQECGACHKFPTANWKEVRKGDEAFPDVTDYPQHASCLNCHRQQFFSGPQPVICSTCHLTPSPRGGPRHPFPNPGEIFDASPKGQTTAPSFAVDFPHEKHKDLFENCATCHQLNQPQGEAKEEFATTPPKDLAETAFWLKKGTFMTAPRSHAACFTCHTEEGLKPASADCATCHKLRPAGENRLPPPARDDFDPGLAASQRVTDKRILLSWSQRETAKFRHEHPVHASVGCADCHNIAQLKTTEEGAPRAPISSCANCHAGDAESFINSEVEQKRARPAFQCSKCHLSNGRRPVPESHLNAAKKG